VTVYDAAGRAVTLSTNITVDASVPGSGSLNAWEEPAR
jgi:hypothetical protein